MKPRRKHRPKGIRGVKESLHFDESKGDISSGSDIWDRYQKDPSKDSGYRSKDSGDNKGSRKAFDRKSAKGRSNPDIKKVPYLRITAIVFLAGAVIFFLASVTVAVYVFLSGSFFVSAENITINIDGPQILSAGERGDFNVTVRNRNDVSLHNTKLVIRYPESARKPEDASSRVPTERIDLGDFSAGGVNRKDISFNLFGKEGEEHVLIVDFEYNIEGSGAQFEKREEFIIKIADTPLFLQLLGPDETYLNSKDEYKVRLKSVSDQVLHDIRISAEYPLNFRIIDSELEMNRDSWRIDGLAPGEEMEFSFSGLFSEYSEDERGRTVSVSAGPAEDPLVSVAESSVLVRVDERAFDIDIHIDRNISFGDTVEGEMVWRNRGNLDLRKATIELSFIGEAMGDFSGDNSRRSGGGLFWGDEDLRFLSDDEIVIPFSFDVLFLKDINDYGIELTASFEGETFAGEIISAEKFESLSLATFFEVGAVSDLRRVLDSEGQVLHPIASDKSGDFTMTISVFTGPGGVTDATVKGVLPSYIEIDSISAGRREGEIEFDNERGEFVWNLGNVDPGSNIWNRVEKRNIFINMIVDPREEWSEEPVAIEFLELVGVDEYTGRVMERTLSNISIYGAGKVDVTLDD